MQETARSCTTLPEHAPVSFTCFTSRRTASRLWESPSCRIFSFDLARCSGVLPARSKASTLAPARCMSKVRKQGLSSRLGVPGVYQQGQGRKGTGYNCYRGKVTSAQQRGDDRNMVRAGRWGGKTQDTQLRGTSKQQSSFCSSIELAASQSALRHGKAQPYGQE